MLKEIASVIFNSMDYSMRLRLNFTKPNFNSIIRCNKINDTLIPFIILFKFMQVATSNYDRFDV